MITKLNDYIMRKTFLTLLLAIFMVIGAQAQTLFGGGLQYYSEGNNIGIQLKSEIGLAENWGLDASAAYVIADGSPFVFDANALARIVRINESTILAPLAGLSLATADGNTDLGINIGAELLVPIQDRYLYIQPKYTVLGVKSFVISAGLFL